jgi:hypothetical protein
MGNTATRVLVTQPCGGRHGGSPGRVAGALGPVSSPRVARREGWGGGCVCVLASAEGWAVVCMHPLAQRRHTAGVACERRQQRDGERGEWEAARRCEARRSGWHRSCPAGGRGSQRVGERLDTAAVGCVLRRPRCDLCTGEGWRTCGCRRQLWPHTAHVCCANWPHIRHQDAAGCGRGCESCERTRLHSATWNVGIRLSGRVSRAAGGRRADGRARQTRRAALRRGACACSIARSVRLRDRGTPLYRRVALRRCASGPATSPTSKPSAPCSPPRRPGPAAGPSPSPATRWSGSGRRKARGRGVAGGGGCAT